MLGCSPMPLWLLDCRAGTECGTSCDYGRAVTWLVAGSLAQEIGCGFQGPLPANRMLKPAVSVAALRPRCCSSALHLGFRCQPRPPTAQPTILH